MTKNFADEEKYVSVNGLDTALGVAEKKKKNGYEVFIELDDCNVYCVHYAYAKNKNYGNAGFYRISEEDAETLYCKHSEISSDKD